MNSLKNSIVAILLLGVSYGVYQVLTTPDPGSPTEIAGSGITIEYPDTNASAAAQTSGAGQSDLLPPNGIGASPSSDKLTPPNGQPGLSNNAKLTPPANLGQLFSGQPNGSFVPAESKQISPTGNASPPAFAPPPLTSPTFPALPSNSLGSKPNNEHGAMESNVPGMQPSKPAVPEFANNQQPSTQMKPFGDSSTTTPPGSFTPKFDNNLAGNAPTDSKPERVSDVLRPSQSFPISNAPTSWMSTWQRGVELAQQGDFRQSLTVLTQLESERALEPTQRQQVLRWLDSLAARVIYSTDHSFAGEPYVCQSNDTLLSVAQQWMVTVQLVYNVNYDAINQAMPNGLKTDVPFPPGLVLKKIQGPFRAEVDLNTGVLTVFADNCYAGRFQSTNQALSQIPTGTFTIQSKSANKDSRGLFCMTMNNPQIVFHGPSQTPGQATQDLVFSEADSRDLFTLLTNGAEVKLFR